MKTRKLILISAIAVLAVLFGLELAFSGHSTVKTLSLSGSPEAIQIAKGDGSLVSLLKEGNHWVVGGKRYSTDPTLIEPMLAAIGELKVLDEVSSGGDDDRYGLGGADGLSVTVTQGEKVLRRLTIGKLASTSEQSYVKLDGGKKVLLVSGNLKKVFGKGIDDLRNREIFNLKEADLSALQVAGREAFQLVKAPAGPTAVAQTGSSWSIEAPAALKGQSLDREKCDGWLSGIMKLKAEGFAPEEAKPTTALLALVSFVQGTHTVTLSIHEKIGDSKYLCSSSETPYPFYLSGYVAERYMKNLKDLMAK